MLQLDQLQTLKGTKFNLYVFVRFAPSWFLTFFVVRRRRRNDITIYSLDMHPSDGYTFIAASGLGDVRQFDMRMIRAFSANAYVNIYKNWEIPGENHPCTGCSFSASGDEVVATFLNDFIYLFDARRNYEKEYNITKETAEMITTRAVAKNSRVRIPKVPEDQWFVLSILK